MPVDKRHWGEAISAFHWLCGRCQSGHIRRNPNAWFEEATADTLRARDHDAWEPDWDRLRFIGLFRCDNPACLDPVSVCGVLHNEHFQVGPTEYDVTTTYWVSSISPAPIPFPIGDAIPEDVAVRLRSAAGLLWSDHDAAANKIRQAVEAMLDERRVKKFPRTGPRVSIALHRRIQDFAAINPSAADHLLAIKWIGNAGSHVGGLSREDVLDALDLMEVALEEIYIGHRRAILKKAKKINTTKKPLGKAKRR